jgi:hypothetical protein
MSQDAVIQKVLNNISAILSFSKFAAKVDGEYWIVPMLAVTNFRGASCVGFSQITRNDGDRIFKASGM